MSRVNLFGLPLILLILSLAACGGSRRGTVEIEPADKDVKEKGDKKGKDIPKPVKKDDGDKKDDILEKFTDLADIHSEVSVLQAFRAFDLSNQQLAAIGKLAASTAQKPPPRKEIQASKAFRTALVALRDALHADDDAKIEAATMGLDALREKEDPEFEPFDLTDAARKEAAVIFASLTARQVVLYLAGLGDNFTDPVELMTVALAQSREKRGKEWRTYRDDVAAQVGWLIGGLDAANEEKARTRTTALLDTAHDLTDKQYDEQKAKLAQSAQELAGKLRALDFIRHYLERVLAETLSNHRLAAAVEGRKKRRGAQ